MSVDVSSLIQDVTDFAVQVRDSAIDTVLAECKDVCPVSEADPIRPYRVPGGLRDSLKIVDIQDAGTTFSAAVVSDLPYAQWTDDVDTPDHEIGPGPIPLVFWWERGPQGPAIYQFHRVHHPGTTGQKWFTDPMPERWDSALNAAAAQI